MQNKDAGKVYEAVKQKAEIILIFSKGNELQVESSVRVACKEVEGNFRGDGHFLYLDSGGGT